MKIAIVTLDGFNELDSFIAHAILNRVKQPGWHVQIVSSEETLTSMNDVIIKRQQPLEFANNADVVLFGSGVKTASFVSDKHFLSQLNLDSSRQLIGAQCSGALFLQALGLMKNEIATDTLTGPILESKGLTVSQSPMYVEGNVASAGGCLASHYLAAWVIAKLINWDAAAEVIHYVAPVGQKDDFVERAAAVALPLL